MDRDRRVSLQLIYVINIIASATVFACAPTPVPGIPLSDVVSVDETSEAEHVPASMSAMELVSEAFAAGEVIPEIYTCDGQDISPRLEWRNPPEASTHVVITVDDPDAPGGTWMHWLAINIPVGIGALEAGLGSDPALGGQGLAGLNGWGETSYGGPCPPSGTHRYFFRVYALDGELSFASPPSISELLQAMTGHILAEASLMGLYARGDS